MMTFLRAFMEGRLFRPESLPVLRQWRTLSFPLEYGGGLMRFRLPGWMTLWRPSPELIRVTASWSATILARSMGVPTASASTPPSAALAMVASRSFT